MAIFVTFKTKDTMKSFFILLSLYYFLVVNVVSADSVTFPSRVEIVMDEDFDLPGGPVSMKRSVVKLDAKKADAKRKRWNAVSESAAKQSKRSLIPEVAPLMTYKEAVKEAAGYDMVFLPYESADGIRKTRELLASVKPGTDIAVFIGPEGGFEDEEVELARENGAEIVTLGKRILRTETAGLCMLSALMLQLEV